MHLNVGLVLECGLSAEWLSVCKLFSVLMAVVVVDFVLCSFTGFSLIVTTRSIYFKLF